MKKGIVRVPEWAKEAFRNGAVVICMDFGAVNQSVVKYNQQQVELEPSLIGNAYVLGGGESFVPKEWIEPIEESINWNRVKVDAPIEVKQDNFSDSEWKPGHFKVYKPENHYKFYIFADGRTSYTSPDGKTWDYRQARFPEGVNPEDHYKAEGEE
jgi:hypothetical protein